MNLLPEYKPVFIGRHEPIDFFYSLRTLREQKNVLYLEAEGGYGKTWLLREYIKHCQEQPRPWHTAPEGVDPLIDFYNLENRTVDGLRRSIARRIGAERFPKFWEVDGLLQQEKTTTRLAELRRDVDFWFFYEFKRALRGLRTYTALFFDTFEVVYNRRVGRWFLEKFIPSRATTGCIIAFAGRPRPIEMIPVNVYCHPLYPFSNEEALEYFKEKWDVRSSGPEPQVIEASAGKPLLLDLIQYVRIPEGTIAGLVQGLREQFENRLVARIIQQPGPQNEVILSMAYLKRRYNRAIFECQYGMTWDLSYEDAERQLSALPFVKFRPGEHALTLHDELQRMIAEQGRGDWRDLADELYETIVQDWYGRAISAAKDTEIALLQAEQLAYILEWDLPAGLELYCKYFKQIKQEKLYDLNDMLWGEVAAVLGNDRMAYDLTQEQANWLFETSRPEDAAFWFEQLVSSRFEVARDSETYTRARIRLGHCYLSLGEVEKAETVWTRALEAATAEENVNDQASFAFNLGHVRHKQGKWDEALALYEEAIHFARVSRNQEIFGEAYFAMARLRARQVDQERAVRELQKGLQITEQRTGPASIGLAPGLIYAGDVYRYLNDPLTAQNYYHRADDLLSNTEEQYSWKVLALAGLGAAYHLSGQIKREFGENYTGALLDQQQALDFFRQSLEVARQHGTESTLHLIFDRMGGCLWELDRLGEKTKETSLEAGVQAFVREAGNLHFPEERSWGLRLREPDVPFERLSLLGKSQRLFEMALFQADKFGEPHLMFDSLIQAASIAEQRGRETDLEYYATLASTLHGLDDPRQETLFISFMDLLEAHTLFATDPQAAADQYASTALNVVESSVFGRYLLQQQLPKIRTHLLSLPQNQSERLCQFLAEKWRENSLLNDFIQGVNDELLFSNG